MAETPLILSRALREAPNSRASQRSDTLAGNRTKPQPTDSLISIEGHGFLP